MPEKQNLEFLDILSILSFILQVQNNTHILSLSDVQEELHKVVGDIHSHLQAQDEKIEKILEALNV